MTVYGDSIYIWVTKVWKKYFSTIITFKICEISYFRCKSVWIFIFGNFKWSISSHFSEKFWFWVKNDQKRSFWGDKMAVFSRNKLPFWNYNFGLERAKGVIHPSF